MTSQTTRIQLKEAILKVDSAQFEEIALEVFRYQATNNPLYAKFIDLLDVDIAKVMSLREIPYLPIQFFKNYTIQSGTWDPVATFTSSGTTGSQTSRHLLREADWYQAISRRCFESFYAAPSEYCILALLPSYLERSGSSLIAMADDFIQQSKYPESGFFLNHTADLMTKIGHCIEQNIPTLLIGVSFALLDFSEMNPMDLKSIIVMETGGMKGRRKELTRGELHEELQIAFLQSNIHSEYGMTELTSQAYSKGKGIFYPGPSMRVLSREINDPFSIQINGKAGVLNIVDLGNLDTCAFIATDDLGKVYPDTSFEVLGRMDHSDLRGCNLMVL